MIPKLIHYCWFGRGHLTPLAERCMDSWQKHMPDYRLMRWDEDNFDVNRLKFTRQACERKKYAFVSDCARLEALRTHGGIYLDSDVEILRPLDDLLELPAFISFEQQHILCAAVIGSEPGLEWLADFETYYAKKPFIRWNGRLNRTPNTLVLSRILHREGVQLDNTYQVYRDQLHIFPSDRFSPKSYTTGEITITANTYSIHHFAGSWTK